MTDTRTVTPPATYPLEVWDEDPAGAWYVEPELREAYAAHRVTFAQATGATSPAAVAHLLHGIGVTTSDVFGNEPNIDWERGPAALLLKISAHTARLGAARNAQRRDAIVQANASENARMHRLV